MEFRVTFDVHGFQTTDDIIEPFMAKYIILSIKLSTLLQPVHLIIENDAANYSWHIL